MSKWVQSRYSKDAKKWEVTHDTDLYYGVEGHHDFLKSEYVECDPPVQWEVCTREAVITDGTGIRLDYDRLTTGYCWAWSDKDHEAIVLKRKVK